MYLKSLLQKFTAKTVFFVFIALLSGVNSFSQTGVAININGSPADPSAMLDVTSNTGGMLIPRMTQAQRIQINNPKPPANGLLVYQTNSTTGFYYYDSSISKWMLLSAIQASLKNDPPVSLASQSINAVFPKICLNFNGDNNTSYSNRNTSFKNIADQSFKATLPGSYVVNITIGTPKIVKGKGIYFRLYNSTNATTVDIPFFSKISNENGAGLTVSLIYNKTTNSSETIGVQWAADSQESIAGTAAVPGASTLKITCIRYPL